MALRAITLGAAEFLGVDGRVGSLEEGKDATILLVDGDPFELGSVYERGWIQGREVAMEDKQTALYEKYREKYRQLGKLRAEACLRDRQRRSRAGLLRCGVRSLDQRS